MTNIAIGFAVIAMLSWGIGDFLIQKSARKIGDWETIFVIAAFGTLILIPFVWKNIPALFSDMNGFCILLGSALVLLLASMLWIEACRVGKMSVVEPALPFEIPAASVLALLILGEKISAFQLVLIIALILGLFLISFRGKIFSFRHVAEKGFLLAFIGSMFMGAGDFLIGWGARETDPLTAYFVVSIVMAVVSASFLLVQGRFRKTLKDIRGNKALLLTMAITDNIAWIGYAFAMTIIPIAVATGLSEASVIVAVMLGLFVNKERLQKHQKVGLFVALASAIVLAFITA